MSDARYAIERLLTTETSPGQYCTGSDIPCPIPSVQIAVRNEDGDMTGCKTLSFPLDAKGVEDIKDNAERASVGLPDRNVVNLDVRKTWQIKPRNLHVSNVEQALECALHAVSRELGTEADYNIDASLYKLLLYEEGCFFARHRDNERLDGMFGTLVLELPSVYEGAELSVWSPLTPDEKMTYTFNGGGSSSKRKSSGGPGLHFAAFYADCYHEVSKLTSGHRVALVYHLTANPVQHRLLPHLPVASPSPSQPADESIAVRLSKLVETFSREDDDDYPSTWDEIEGPGKPNKLVVVLSHHYTPASLTSIRALKGSDRSIAELIRAAAFCSPDADVTSLARLAARKVVEVGGEQYATDPEGLLAHELTSEEFKGKDGGPFFDAAISLACVHDSGEITQNTLFRTTGPLISLTGENTVPLDLGPERPNDREAD